MISFNVPYISGEEMQYVADAIERRNLSGEGFYTKACQKELQKNTGAKQVLLTPSCTNALELSALLLNLREGDEVIMSSFTFVSTANAFVLRGAIPVFVDIRPDTMNINEELIESAITSKTKAIVVMHYAGVACEMDRIMNIAENHELMVIEDAAQCIGAFYKEKHLGAIGHFGALSFHSTKNIHCGEGGALLVNDEKFTRRAAIIREKGTNRDQFLKGEIDKYSWVDIGSSFLIGELNAAFLYNQINNFVEVIDKRKFLWEKYYLEICKRNIEVDLPVLPEETKHNGHIFYIKCKNYRERKNLISFLKKKEIGCAFHYIPLHNSKAGCRFGRFHGKDVYTSVESERLLRLPLFASMKEEEVIKVVEGLESFFKSRK